MDALVICRENTKSGRHNKSAEGVECQTSKDHVCPVKSKTSTIKIIVEVFRGNGLQTNFRLLQASHENLCTLFL